MNGISCPQRGVNYLSPYPPASYIIQVDKVKIKEATEEESVATQAHSQGESKTEWGN